MPKKFLFIAGGAMINDLAWQVYKEKNQVKYFINLKKYKTIADGFVPKIDNWQKSMAWADVVVLEQPGIIKGALLKKYAHKIIGHSRYTDRLEYDRGFGQEELKKAGVNILPYREFDDLDQAMAYIKKKPAAYVLKMSGEAGFEKSLLYVGNLPNGQDVIERLRAIKKNHQHLVRSFILQKKVTGVEIAVGGFFNGHKFLQPIYFNFEHKRFFPGDLGPLTSEMGTSMFWAGRNRLFRESIGKMEKLFAQAGYVGYVDLNCLVDKNGIYPLEFTSRFGYPTICIQQEGINMPMGKFLADLVAGKDFTIPLKGKYQVGMRILMPPHPFNSKKDFETYSQGAKVEFLSPDLSGIHIEDLIKIKNEWRVAGEDGFALIIAGCGQTMAQARGRAYQNVKKVYLPNMYYRNDIGAKWPAESKLLKRWGYI